jgi:hypothetical protein
MVIRRALIFLVFIFMASVPPVFGISGDLKKVLILYENVPSPVRGGLGYARQLRQLLGHFQTEATLKAAGIIVLDPPNLYPRRRM